MQNLKFVFPLVIIIFSSFILFGIVNCDYTELKTSEESSEPFEKSTCEENNLDFYYRSGQTIKALNYLEDENYSVENKNDSLIEGIVLCEEFMFSDSTLYSKGLSILQTLCENDDYNACAYFAKYKNRYNDNDDKLDAWKELMDKGSDVAMYFYGIMSNSKGIVRKVDTLLLQKACESGNIEACEKLAELSRNSDDDNLERNYLNIADTLGSLNAKFDLSRFLLVDFIENQNMENLYSFEPYFECGKFSKYPIYLRYFEYGKILYSSDEQGLRDFGERLIVTSSTWGFGGAKSFMLENNILFNESNSDIGLSVIENNFIITLKGLIN